MEPEERYQNYLAKAEDAEVFALQASDLVLRNTWLRIAQSYRDLALFTQRKSTSGLSWIQASPVETGSVTDFPGVRRN